MARWGTVHRQRPVLERCPGYGLRMSKYRCPVCGAPHKDPVARCRLCGQDMSTPTAVPAGPGGARQAAGPKKGIGVFVLAAIAIVVVLVGGALFLGLTRDSEAVDQVTQQIPGMNETSDGWVAIEDLDGRFTAWMPPGNTSDASAADAAPSAAGRWVGELGDETTVSIAYYDVGAGDGESAISRLNAFAEDLAAGRPTAELNRPTTETSFAGYPALQISLRYPGPGEARESKILLVLKGERIYLLESYSVYPGHPSFGKLVDRFSFTQPPSQ